MTDVPVFAQSPPFTAEGAAGATVGTREQIVLKQLVAVIDSKTTMICLRAAGQIQPLHEPFDTLNGPFQEPPFHVHCRSQVVPWMPGMVSKQRAAANREISRRPPKQRRFGPEGYTGSLPPPPRGPAPPSEGQWLGARKPGVGRFPFGERELRLWEDRWLKTCPSNTVRAAMDWQGRFMPDWIRDQFEGFGRFDPNVGGPLTIAYAHPVTRQIYIQPYVWNKPAFINNAWREGLTNGFYMRGSGTYGTSSAWTGINGTVSHETGHIVWYGIHNGPFRSMPGIPPKEWLVSPYQFISDYNKVPWGAQQLAFVDKVHNTYETWREVTRAANDRLIASVMSHVLPGVNLGDVVPVDPNGRSLVPFDTFFESVKQNLTLQAEQRFYANYSKYAAQNFQEFMAECWSEFTTSPSPRPAALEIGTIMQDLMLDGSKLIEDWGTPSPEILANLPSGWMNP